MSLLLSALMSHILSLLEKELAANEPEAVAMICKEVDAISQKLQALISNRVKAVAPIANPLVSLADRAVDAGIVSAGALLQQQSQG